MGGKSNCAFDYAMHLSCVPDLHGLPYSCLWLIHNAIRSEPSWVMLYAVLASASSGKCVDRLMTCCEREAKSWCSQSEQWCRNSHSPDLCCTRIRVLSRMHEYIDNLLLTYGLKSMSWFTPITQSQWRFLNATTPDDWMWICRKVM